VEVKLADARYAIEAGADEVDMVIDRGAFLAGDYQLVYDEIAAVRDVVAGPAGPAGAGGTAGRAHLKVILETGELVTLDNVRRASWLAMLAGADFIKTSTGKVTPAATLPVTLVMLEAVRDFRATHGRQVGVKPAGGIRTAKDAIRYLVLVNETAGEDWLDPQWFRIGASSLLNDLLMQRTKLATGRYSGPDYFTLD
jgi:deoxyribose-phosphate aldolase